MSGGLSGQRTKQRAAAWIGAASLEALARLAIQFGVTAILARLLTPEDFGLAALALSAGAIMAVFGGGIPFEEALTQRQVTRRAHFEAALAVSWLTGLAFVAATWLVGGVLAAGFDQPELRGLLVAAGVLVLLHAPWTILTALARRQKRFEGLAQASFAGHLIGAVVGIGMALAGLGVWALIGFRIAVVAASACALALLLRTVFVPRWSTQLLGEIWAYSRISLAERAAENLTYLVFNYAVGALYGLAALGHLNLALRIVEPLRGAFQAISHNIAFPFLRAAPDRSLKLVGTLMRVMWLVGLAAAPAFLGLAAVSAPLVLVLAGDQWLPAAPLVALLAAGASLATVWGLLFTATNAQGQPSYSLFRRILGFLAISTTLVVATPLGIIATALSRLIGDVVETIYAALVAQRRLNAPRGALAVAAIGPWLRAAAMALLVYALAGWLETRHPPLVTLLLAIVAGAACYAVIVMLTDRSARTMATEQLRRRLLPCD